MHRYTVDLPSYTIGTTAYEAVSEICIAYGRKVALLVGNYGYPLMAEDLSMALLEANSELILSDAIPVKAECTDAEIARLADLAEVQEAHMIFVVGGGKVIDTGKAVADEVGKPVFTFPTIASNCAATTAVSIIYNEDGGFVRPRFLKNAPAHCFMDTEILSAAPTEYLWAGMGDTYAKYYEASIASRGEALSHPLALGVHLSRQCADNILDHGVAGYATHRKGEVNDAFEQTVLTVIVTTGLVSILVTLNHSPDYNSDLAHAIYYVLTRIPTFDHVRNLHGSTVGYGVLILLLMDSEFVKEQREEWGKVAAFNREVGLPVSLADLGLSYSDVEPYLADMTQMSDVQHHPYTITVDGLRTAFLEQERWAQAHG